MNSPARGPRSRWVGPPVPAPKSKLSRSPFGRQRHYGAVELAGAGEQVNVNDVVEVTDNEKHHQETSKRHPLLVQVRLNHTFRRKFINVATTTAATK